MPALFLLANGAMAAIPQEWQKTPYAHEANNLSVPDFLGAFAHTVGLQLQIDGALQGVVNGKLRADTLTGLMERLALEHRFQWFVHNNTLYISSLDQQTTSRLEVADDTIADLKQALTRIGLLDERFGWGELPDIGVVLVSGPKRYIEQIRQFSRKRAEPANKQDVLTFTLQFANAADRQIDYRGEKLSVPGIASLLRGLLDTKSSSPFAAPSPGPSPVSGMASRMPYSSNPPAPALTADLKSSGLNAIRVEADVRNNSVLIYDASERRTLYQALIAKLDVPRKLVEIDAVILDINRTQLNELGTNWGFQSGRFGMATGLSGTSPTTVSMIQADRFAAEIKALEARGLATVVSNPSIMTLENQPAVIDFNRTQYIQAVGEGVANIMPVTTGTSFQVIPRVIEASGANQIHLIIDIEDGTFADNTGQHSTPDVRKGNISTQAVIHEKQSLVIGGFHVAEEVDSRNQVPVLGNIPWLGKLLFSSTQNTKNRRERLFILTPRLIGDQTNPARYLPQSDQAQLEAALTPLRRRDGKQPVIQRSDITRVFRQLVTGHVPGRFTAMPMPPRTGSLCKAFTSLKVDTERHQWYESEDYNVAVLVLHNQSQSRVRVDERDCSTAGTLAVSVWPTPWLAPGEHAEVFIATRAPDPDEQSSVSRPSLLEATP
ncbi:type III secretion system outer membrane ring subunit SctC [Pseudomonas sp. FSL R10-2964]|uniref:type III secretion system outer membrane ring subunit SctC n=1 Tax=Pseudomonas sp. FSL R10-2964 TaxID=2662202 RepID=UPI002113BA62|nr:type III secretion system outer membrane ring subunit SctC [Pseudomonas sp. FSL R10-2964]